MVHDSVLKQVESDDLSVFAVWMPVLASDNAEESKKAESLLPDPRVAHYWDGDNSIGKLYGRQLTLPRGRQLAWDIYFVYAPGVRWEDEPPAPTAWMHQLARDERLLSGDGLRRTIQKLLGIEETAADPATNEKRTISF